MKFIKLFYIKISNIFILIRSNLLEKKNFFLKNKKFKIKKKFEIEKDKKIVSIDKFSKYKTVNFYYKPRNGYLLDTVYFSPFNSLAFKDNDYF